MRWIITLVCLLIGIGGPAQASHGTYGRIQVAEADDQLKAAIKKFKRNNKGRILSVKRTKDGKARVKILTPKGLIRVIIVDVPGG